MKVNKAYKLNKEKQPAELSIRFVDDLVFGSGENNLQ